MIDTQCGVQVSLLRCVHACKLQFLRLNWVHAVSDAHRGRVHRLDSEHSGAAPAAALGWRETSALHRYYAPLFPPFPGADLPGSDFHECISAWLLIPALLSAACISCAACALTTMQPMFA